MTGSASITLPAVGTTLVVEINRALVDAVVLSYSKGKKVLDDASTEGADSVKLKLLGLPVGDRTIETDTVISVKYLAEIVKESTAHGKEQEQVRKDGNDGEPMAKSADAPDGGDADMSEA